MAESLTVILIIFSLLSVEASTEALHRSPNIDLNGLHKIN